MTDTISQANNGDAGSITEAHRKAQAAAEREAQVAYANHRGNLLNSSHEAHLRMEALRLANGMDASPESTVARAAVYLAFLKGDA